MQPKWLCPYTLKTCGLLAFHFTAYQTTSQVLLRWLNFTLLHKLLSSRYSCASYDDIFGKHTVTLVHLKYVVFLVLGKFSGKGKGDCQILTPQDQETRLTRDSLGNHLFDFQCLRVDIIEPIIAFRIYGRL